MSQPSHTRNLLLLIFLALACVPPPATALAQDVPELQINSERYIVLDADNGNIYVQKGAGDRVAIASLTKVFTAVQALEMASLDMEITTDESDLFGSNSTLMGFGPGEAYTLRDLLFGMMLPSGNDAAHAIARALGAQPGDSPEQSVDRFVGWMNQRNIDLGLTDTHLLNPTGWGVEGHYSSARDVATFVRYALGYPDLVEAMGTHSYTTSNGYLTVTNTNKLLSTYDLLEGGKTGFDNDAGYCLIEFAQLDGNTMISVTLDGLVPDDWYDDNRVLLNYAFNQKTEMASRNESFSGQVATYLDPAAGEISRAAEVSGSFAAGSEIVASTSTRPLDQSASLQEAPRDRSVASKIGQQGEWIAAGIVVSLFLLRGLWTFRRHSRHDRSNVDRSALQP